MAYPIAANEERPPFGLRAYAVPTVRRYRAAADGALCAATETVRVCTTVAQRMRAEQIFIDVGGLRARTRQPAARSSGNHERSRRPRPLWAEGTPSVRTHTHTQTFHSKPLPGHVAPDPLLRVQYLQEKYMEVLVRPALAWGLLHEIANYEAVAVWQPSSEIVPWPPFNDRDAVIVGMFEHTEAAYDPDRATPSRDGDRA